MLLLEIYKLLLSTVAGLLGSVLLLRIYLAWLRVSRSNPLTIFCIALTEWLVGPLRRALPVRGRFDVAALAAALAVAFAFVFLMAIVRYNGVWHWYLFFPSMLLLVLHWVLYLAMFLVIANAVLSMVNPHAPLAPIFDVLTRPILAPLRRLLPPIGGFDLSPLLLIVLVQIALLVLDQLML